MNFRANWSYFDNRERNPIDEHRRRVLCALGFYASGSYQRVVGNMSDISVCQATVSNAIEEVTTALNRDEVLARFIRFPTTRQESEFVITRNERLGMPRVLGFIDGTLIKIVPPPRALAQEVYYCRKGYPALNVQILCDSDLYIMDINARFPGSANDSYIYEESGVRRVMQQAYRESRCWLLGDSIYPLHSWLHTPIPDAPQGTPEYYYTKLHCHCRNPVERCNEVLKGRWRCLLHDRTLHYLPVKAGRIINACAVLHNFCIFANLEDPKIVEPNLPDVLNIDEEGDEEIEEVDEAVLQNRLQLRQEALAEKQRLINYAYERRLELDN